MSKHPVVQEVEWGNMSPTNALDYLGKQITAAKEKGISTAYFEEAVNQILGMPEEPADESTGRREYSAYLGTNSLDSQE